MKSTLRYLVIYFIGFSIYYYIDAVFFLSIQKKANMLFQSVALSHIIAYILTLIPLLIITSILHKSYRDVFERLGLSNGFFIGIIFAFVSTLPLMGYTIKFSLNDEILFDTLIIQTIDAAFFEEIIFRAFLFGMLYRFTKIGFLPSVFLCSFLFGILHLYQSNMISELFGIFLITFLGSALFAWIYSEWNFNLWTAIFLHFFMNLYWIIFDIDNNALGGVYANALRFLAVIFSIILTVIYKKKKKIPFEVNRKTLWKKI